MVTTKIEPVSIEAFYQAAKLGDVSTLHTLMTALKPVQESPLALVMAAGGGHVEAVSVLLPMVKTLPSQAASSAFVWAMEVALRGGHADVIKILLPGCSHESDDLGYAFCEAAKKGSYVCVQLLMEHPSAKAVMLKAIIVAAESGHLEMVHLLKSALPVHLGQSILPLLAAARNHQTHMVAEILKGLDVERLFGDRLDGIHNLKADRDLDDLGAFVSMKFLERLMDDDVLVESEVPKTYARVMAHRLALNVPQAALTQRNRL